MAVRKSKNIEPDAIEGIPELKDDEQFVSETHTKRTVRKERAPQPEAIDPEADDEDLVFLDEEPDDDRPTYSDTSLAALQFGPDSEEGSGYFNVLVRRNPDGMNDRFVRPNNAVLTLPALRNVDIATERADIEERIRELFGGGHYFFQIQYRGQIGRSWTSSLSDSPEQIRTGRIGLPEPQPQPEPTAPIPAPALAAPAANPFDQFFETLAKQKQMKDLLFGDEQKRYEDRIADLERRIEDASRNAGNHRQSETLSIIEKALSAEDKNVAEKLMHLAFPESQDTGGHWITDVVKIAFEHKEDLAGFASLLFGGLAPQPKPTNLDALLRSQPPAQITAAASADPPTELAAPVSRFSRRAKPEEPANTESSQENTDLEATESNTDER